MQRHHTLQRRLLHRYDASVADTLAQQHAEHGRLGRIVPQLLRHMDAGLVGVGAQQQSAAAPQKQHHLIPCGLLNFLDPRAGQLRRKLIHHCPQADGIQRHGSFLHHDIEQFVDPFPLSVEIQPAQQRFQRRCLLILGAAGVVRDGMNVGVPSPLEHGVLLLRQQRQYLLAEFRLLRRAHQLDGGPMQSLTGGLSVGAQPRAHQKLIYAVPQMGKADAADGPYLVSGQLYGKIICHIPYSFFEIVPIIAYSSPGRKACACAILSLQEKFCRNLKIRG